MTSLWAPEAGPRGLWASLAQECSATSSIRWSTRSATGAELLRRVQELPGFGRQKAQIFVALLAKQLGVRLEGWTAAAGDYALEGHRSVADVVDGDSLQNVRDHKRQDKAAAKLAGKAAG